ncbi:MAG: hypothetical protein JEY79_11180 [Pseudodesulfovibrio sp.]|nr:hypothetical protein [Pseudodesulfovibrio sp.]
MDESQVLRIEAAMMTVAIQTTKAMKQSELGRPLTEEEIQEAVHEAEELREKILRGHV